MDPLSSPRRRYPGESLTINRCSYLDLRPTVANDIQHLTSSAAINELEGSVLFVGEL